MQVRLVEHRRAHNILIELSGIRKPFDEIKVGSSGRGGSSVPGAPLPAALRPTGWQRAPFRRWWGRGHALPPSEPSVSTSCIRPVMYASLCMSASVPSAKQLPLPHVRCSRQPLHPPHPVQDALLRMDAGALSVEQLSVLSRAVPDDQERKDLELYMAGKHPKYKYVQPVICCWKAPKRHAFAGLSWALRRSCAAAAVMDLSSRPRPASSHAATPTLLLSPPPCLPAQGPVRGGQAGHR